MTGLQTVIINALSCRSLACSYNSIIEITDYNTDHVRIGTAGNFK